MGNSILKVQKHFKGHRISFVCSCRSEGHLPVFSHQGFSANEECDSSLCSGLRLIVHQAINSPTKNSGRLKIRAETINWQKRVVGNRPFKALAKSTATLRGLFVGTKHCFTCHNSCTILHYCTVF